LRVIRFEPQSVDLPDAWPACRASRCGSRQARARIDAPLGPVTVECENGHFRGYRAVADFRSGGRYAGVFGASTLDAERADASERRAEPGPRRRTEVLEDAVCCALCGVPPAEHPLRPDDGARTDRELWAWLQRWRPAAFVELANAAALARNSDPRKPWRLAIPAATREAVVDAQRSSSLTTDAVIPPERLAAVAGALTKRELDYAAGLLFAACVSCVAARRTRESDAGAYLRTYVDALYGGDERRARADAARWRTIRKVAHAAAAREDVRAGTA
jgi:hypothetical protein